MANDEELAEANIDLPQTAPEQRISRWSPEVEVLTLMFDRLGSLVAATVAASGNKPPEIPPYPRPVTAFERAKLRSVRNEHERLVARLLPD